MSTSFTQQNQLLVAFKKLAGKTHTNADFQSGNETTGSLVQLGTDTIFGESIPNLTAAPSNYAITQNSATSGVVETVPFVLESISLSQYVGFINSEDTLSGTTIEQVGDNNTTISSIHAYALKFPSDYEDFSSNPREGTAAGFGFANNATIPTSNGKVQIIPESFGLGYIPVVKDSAGSQIFGTDGENWFLDTFAGVLFVQDQGDASGNLRVPASVTASVYIGKYATETINSASVAAATPGLHDVLTVANTSSVSIGLSGSDVSDTLGDNIPVGTTLFVSGGAVDFANASSISGSLISASTLTLGSTLDVAGNVTLGSADTNTVTITGNLVVEGTTVNNVVNINSTNLNVEDKFILLNSGSITNDDGGIMVQTHLSDDGDNDAAGTMFAFDADLDRWKLVHSSSDQEFNISATPEDSVSDLGSSLTPMVPTIEVRSGAPLATSVPVFGNVAGGVVKGQFYVDTSDDHGLYIYV